MALSEPGRGMPTRRWRTWSLLLVSGAAVVALVVLVAIGCGSRQVTSSPLPVRVVGEVALPGDGSRFDYASVDVDRGLLFIAHLGAREVIEVDVHAPRGTHDPESLAGTRCARSPRAAPGLCHGDR